MIEARYNPQGGVSTQTQGLPPAPGFQMPGLPFDPSAAIRERLAREAEDKAYERSMRERAMKMQEAEARQRQQAMATQQQRETLAYNNRGNQARESHRVDPLAAIKAQDQYELTRRSAAMRPTGLGAQMIPGMAADPRLLPSRMLPGGSSFQGTPGPSMAGLSREAEPMASSSNRGYDFADPYAQSQIQRASFGPAPGRR